MSPFRNLKTPKLNLQNKLQLDKELEGMDREEAGIQPAFFAAITSHVPEA